MAKKKAPYFDDFVEMMEVSVQAAEFLQATLLDFDPAILEEKCEEMHEIENRGDYLKHEMMNRLLKEFITPIDREDIVAMAGGLDDITDKIEDVLLRLRMYNITEIPEAAKTYAGIIIRACQKLGEAMKEFSNFRKSTTLQELIIEINSIEEEGDRLYVETVSELFRKEKNPIAITAWSKLFDLMEDCCDCCEHVADVIEVTMMKNS